MMEEIQIVKSLREKADSENRRSMLRFGAASLTLPLLSIFQTGCAPAPGDQEPDSANESTENETAAAEGPAMRIHYLEIVSVDVDAICRTYEQLQGLQFGEPEVNFGNARLANLPDDGLLGVRAPLRDSEQPVVRPYFLVKDIKASVSDAEELGAKIAVPPMELPGYGQYAVLIQGGVEYGFWQSES